MKILGIAAFIVFCILLIYNLYEGEMSWWIVFVPIIGWGVIWILQKVIKALLEIQNDKRNRMMEHRRQRRSGLPD